MTLVVDISHVGQGALPLSTFQAWKTAGVTDIVVKAGGADDGLYKDPAHDQHAAFARQAGLKVHHYFFNGPISPTTCADAFVSYAAVQPGETLWWDCEAEGSSAAIWTPAEVLEGNARIRTHNLPTPGVYGSESPMSSQQWLPVKNDGSKLWVASYGANDGSKHGTPNTGVWPGYVWWQYTSVGTLPGYGGHLDLSTSGAETMSGTTTTGDDEMKMARVGGVDCLIGQGFVFGSPNATFTSVLNGLYGSSINVDANGMNIICRANGIPDAAWNAAVKAPIRAWSADLGLFDPSSGKPVTPVPAGGEPINPLATSGTDGATDLTPVLQAIAQVPTAAENGNAARTAIVK